MSIQVYCRFSAVSHSMSGRDLKKDSLTRLRARTKAEKEKKILHLNVQGTFSVILAEAEAEAELPSLIKL